MNINKITLVGGTIVAFVFLALVSAAFLIHQPAKASPSWLSNILTVATSSTAVSVTASTRVLATTTINGTPGVGQVYTRVYATICNPSSTVVFLNMNRDIPADVTHSVYQIAGAAGYQSCYEITDRNLYQGSIQASSTVGATSVYVTEYVQ